MMAEQKDTPMGDAPESAGHDATAPLLLSEDETRVLALYDQLRTVQLKIALLKARQSFTGDPPTDIEAAQQDLLEARSAYVLRCEAVDSVLTVNPVLKAVYRATQASPIERDLLPALEQRDAASQAAARDATARRAVHDECASTAVECRRVEQENVRLAAQIRELVTASEAAETENEGGGGADEDNDGTAAAVTEFAELTASVKASRQRWKLIKGTASAIVAGSGVDWARDAALRDIVLDPD